MSASCLAPVIASLQAQITAGGSDVTTLSGEVATLSGEVASLTTKVNGFNTRPYGIWLLSSSQPITTGNVEVAWDLSETGTDTTYISAPSLAGYFTVNISGLYQLEYHHSMGESSPGTGSWSANTRFGSQLVAVETGIGVRIIYETSAYPPSSGSGGEPSSGGGSRLIYLEAGDMIATFTLLYPPSPGSVSNVSIYGVAEGNPDNVFSFFSWRYIQPE